MAQVQPFRAIRYNPEQTSFQKVLTQPYDKISPEMQDKYYAADPHNLITVEKGRVFPTDTPQSNVYTRAAAALQDWIQKNVIVQDPAPAFYAYSQEYTVPGTQHRRTRHGDVPAVPRVGLPHSQQLAELVRRDDAEAARQAVRNRRELERGAAH